jgi:hypothetical protein
MAHQERDDVAVTRKLFEHLIEDGIGPNLDAISEIAGRDELPVLVFELNDAVREDIQALGWKGESVFAMAKPKAARVFRDVDAVTAPWILRPHPIDGFHLLVFTGLGSLLVNWDPKVGFRLEPGSTDRESQN